jgi:hypothetical protein
MIVETISLDVVAARMKLFAEQNPYGQGIVLDAYRRELSRKLIVTLLLDAQGWYFEIARFGTKPSPQEETICKRYFGIPKTADRAENSIKQGGKDRNAIRWRWKAGEVKSENVSEQGASSGR